MMDRLFKGLRSVLYGFSVTAMSLMLIIIFSQVVTRYVFDWTPEWSEELSRFLFVWVVFLGSALIMGESGHLAVQFVPNHFKGTTVGNVLEIIINLSGYVFILILLVQGTADDEGHDLPDGSRSRHLHELGVFRDPAEQRAHAALPGQGHGAHHQELLRPEGVRD